ncbi:MAG TPA: serine/threonine-protein kinase [Polyangia bacterium]|jgi:serine/threonine-protein kinase
MSRDGVVSISATPGGARPPHVETPPFGISALPSAVGAIPGSSSGVPSRVGEGRSARIPFRVGQYEVATRIAQGGTGSIYVCRRANGPQPQSLLTLKVIRQHALAKDAAAFSFKREARVGALFRHPNAQTVIDVGVYDEQPFLILPYVEGGNLAVLLSDDARPAPAAIVTVLLDVLRALQHAHRISDEHGQFVGLVHGDISPENILVGTDGVARLTDFGSARFTAESSGGSADAFGFGKPSYMSPEQLRGEPLDARADIFAVGVVMWTALTGQKLFAAETYDQTVIRVMRRKIPAPSTLGGPTCLDEVCLQALSRSPEGRFASAAEMADALTAATVKNDMIATRERVAQWVRRDLGEQLGERRRRIEHMFGDKVKGQGPSNADFSVPRPEAPTGSGNRMPAPTMQMNAPRASELGAVKSASMPTMLISPERTEPSTTRLSRSQWYVIVTVSLATFFLTLALGTWISRMPASRRAPAPNPAAQLPAPPSAPSAAELPSAKTVP